MSKPISQRERARRDQQRLLTVAEVADRLGIGISTTWQWVSAGRLPAPLRLSRRCSRWDSEAIETWLAEQAEVLA